MSDHSNLVKKDIYAHDTTMTDQMQTLSVRFNVLPRKSVEGTGDVRETSPNSSPVTPDQKLSEGGWLLVCNYRGQHFESHKNLHVELLSSAGMQRRLDQLGSQIRCQILLRI